MQKIKTAEVIAAYELLARYKKQIQEEIKQREEEIKQLDREIQVAPGFDPETTLEYANMSVRLFNILRPVLFHMNTVSTKKNEWGQDSYTIRDASNVSLRHLRTCRNCGEGTIKEFKNLVTTAGLTFKP